MRKNNKGLTLINKACEGFTLIELLIVIIIIGILSSLIFTNFAGVRQRGRDSQRKSDVQQIRAALEIYRADTRSYPIGPLPSCGSPFKLETTVYMQKIPCDPLGVNVSYTYTSNGSTYSIVACLENANDADKDATDACAASDRVSFTVQNP